MWHVVCTEELVYLSHLFQCFTCGSPAELLRVSEHRTHPRQSGPCSGLLPSALAFLGAPFFLAQVYSYNYISLFLPSTLELQKELVLGKEGK